MTGMSTASVGTLTTIRVKGESNWILNRLEQFFFKVTTAFTRKRNSIKADLAHPDGFTVRVSAKCYVDPDDDDILVEILRLSGDAVLFNIVYQLLRDFDFGRGDEPKQFYEGQMCPRIVQKPLPPPTIEVEDFVLDHRGVKRKIEML